MTSGIKAKKNIFILGIGSDIGKELAKLYSSNGCKVAGTYRKKETVSDFLAYPNIRLFRCDIAKKADIKKTIKSYEKSCSPWGIFISCIGSMEPIGKFFGCNIDEWERSVIINSTAQLRFLHSFYPQRRKGKISNVIFFTGGGTNSPFTNYSAYCVSKILLMKMCELLDDEDKELNTFIIGPGWVRTKIHKQTLRNRSLAGNNYGRTEEFLKSGKAGTSYRDIYDCINWCIRQGRRVVGGRNFSVVHDPWKGEGAKLTMLLSKDSDKFKLRRFKN